MYVLVYLFTYLPTYLSKYLYLFILSIYFLDNHPTLHHVLILIGPTTVIAPVAIVCLKRCLGHLIKLSRRGVAVQEVVQNQQPLNAPESRRDEGRAAAVSKSRG